MAFPWFTLVMWVVSFFLSKNAGMSNGKAALLATGAAAATYVTADPANKKNLLGIGVPKGDTTPPTASDEGAASYNLSTNSISNPEDDEAHSPLSESTIDSKREDSDAAVADVLGKVVTTTGGVAETAITSAKDVAVSFGPDGLVKTAVGVKASDGIADGISDAARGAGGVFKDPATAKFLVYGGLGLLALMLLK